MATGEQELHTLVGAYVMDAVTDFERIQFTRHLASCAECRDEIRELHEAAARLGTASAVRPRTGLKDPTIQAARRISQLAPAVPAAATDGSRADRRRRASPRSAGSRRAWRWLTALPRSAVLACAILTASAIGLAVVNQQMNTQLDHSQRQSHLIATVLNAPDMVILTAKISTGGTATVMMSHRRHALVFTAHGLQPLPASESYELWLMGPDGDRSAGLLRAPGGTAGPAVVSGLAAGDMIGLTVEPASGSARPTSPPIVLIGPKHH